MTEEVEAFVTDLEEVRDHLEKGTKDDYQLCVTLCEKLLRQLDSSEWHDGSILRKVLREIHAKSLLHGERFQQVLEIEANLDDEAIKPLKLYAQYRLSRYDEVLAQVPSNDMEKHVLAQAWYHMSESEKALQSYVAMMNGSNDNDLLLDVMTNALAVLVSNATPYDFENQSNLLQQAAELSQESYDLAYNMATLKLLAAKTATARQTSLQLLRYAQQQCSAHADDKDCLARELHPLLLQEMWGSSFWGLDAAVNTSKVKGSPLNFFLEQVNPVLDAPAIATAQQVTKTRQSLELLLNTQPLTPLQKRLVWYNHALLSLQLRDYEKCHSSLDALGQSLGLSKKKTKTKLSTTFLPTFSEEETLWWQVRMVVAQAYARQQELGDLEKPNSGSDIEKKKNDLRKLFTDAMSRISSLASSDGTQLLDNVYFYLKLHGQQLQKPEFASSFDDRFQWLMDCHTEKSFPAVTASLAKGFQERNQPVRAKEIIMNGSPNGGNHILAQMASVQEQYDEAVALYDQSLQQNSSDRSTRSKLVEVLSHVDPERAIKEWKTLEKALTDHEYDDSDEALEDGEALEMRELPRIKHVAVALSSGFNAATAKTASKKNKKSQESVLRQRTSRRETYLKDLQEKGLYHPSRPTQPDPERWIPKQERQRRRRRGGATNKASQGGFFAKDAAKLDVAAQGRGDSPTTGPTTAHLTVAGGSRKGGRRR